MKMKLDHIWGNVESGSSADITAIQNQLNSLSQIAAKTNLDNRFTTNQTIPSVIITGAIDANNKAATKNYVDDKFSYVALETWTGNINGTNLSWTKNNEFNTNGTGHYEFHIRMLINNQYIYFTEKFKLDNLSGTWIGPVHWFKLGAIDSSAIQSSAETGFSFVYQNKAVKLVKYGSGFPTATNSVVAIFWKKVW